MDKASADLKQITSKCLEERMMTVKKILFNAVGNSIPEERIETAYKKLISLYTTISTRKDLSLNDLRNIILHTNQAVAPISDLCSDIGWIKDSLDNRIKGIVDEALSVLEDSSKKAKGEEKAHLEEIHEKLERNADNPDRLRKWQD